MGTVPGTGLPHRPALSGICGNSEPSGGARPAASCWRPPRGFCAGVPPTEGAPLNRIEINGIVASIEHMLHGRAPSPAELGDDYAFDAASDQPVKRGRPTKRC
jgi:hypothetical protein